jgi:multiple sugar transport system permease protein
MHWSGEGGQEEDAIAEELLADFEAENPDIQVRRINPGDAGSFYTKLQTMAAGGTPPDVFYVGSERLPAFASMGLIAPVNESAIDLSDFYPATLDAFRFDGTASGQGTLYGIPKDFTTMGFYANRSLFEQAGLPWPKDDWTWNEFIQTASALGGLEGITGAEFVTWPMMVRLYLRTWGLDLVSPDFKTLRLKDPAVVEALSRLRNWRHDRTNFPNALTSGKSKVATGASVFLTGKVGMAGPFGRWVVPSYRKIPSPESGGFDWDFLPLPRAEGHPPRNAIATVAWCVSSKTKHPASAQALVEHLCGPKGQSLAAPLGLAVPTRKSVANSPAFLDSKTPPFRDDLFLSQAENAAAIAWPSDSRFEAQLNWRLSSALQSGDSTLEEASSAFEQDWELVASSPLARTDFPDMPWDRIRAWVTTLIALLLAIGALRWWRGRPGKLEAQEERWGLALLSPWVLGFLLFMAFPIGLSLLLSFSKWNGVSELGTASYVGLANYSQLLSHDGRFLTSLRVTAWYSLLAVPLGQLAALGAALLMNSKVRGIGFFRAAWYLPSVLAGVGISVLWRWVFDGDHGLMNSGLNAVLHSPLLSWAGLSAPEWFGADAAIWGPPAFVIMSLWAVGGPMMIYLAGLQGISQDLYEAAEIDGAGRWARFRHVTLPMLSPIIFFNTIMAVIGSFQVFTQAFVMTGGEPGDLTRFFVLYLFNQAFEFYEMGYASSMAWILLLVTLVLTLILMKGSKRFVHYEALQG